MCLKAKEKAGHSHGHPLSLMQAQEFLVEASTNNDQ
jgi:hypothetical protein